MSEVFKQPKRESGHLINELENISRDSIVLSGGNFVSGEVLGMSADGTKFIKLNVAASGAGTEAKGILFGNIDATVNDVQGLAHTRVTAVIADRLVWPANITAARKAEFVADLVALNIIPR